MWLAGNQEETIKQAQVALVLGRFANRFVASLLGAIPLLD
jgi:hypothetical protein